MKRFFLWALLAGALSACGDNSNVYLGNGDPGNAPAPQLPPVPPAPVPPPHISPPPYEGLVEQEFRQRKRTDKVDMLFSIDHSGSMSGHIRKVARNISVLTDRLLRDRVDFQMGFLMSSEDSSGFVRPGLKGPHPVIRSSDRDVPLKVRANLDSILAEPEGGTELGVSILEEAIQYPINRTLFRDDSAKAFLVLTDADDDMAGEEKVPHFIDVFDRFAGEYPWIMIGIGHASGTPDCGLEEPNQPLLEQLIRLSGGTFGNICAEDFSDTLAKAADRVVHLLDEFSLARFPELARAEILRMTVTVDGVAIPVDPVNGYTWHADRQAIAFHGRSIPVEGAVIRIRVEYRVRE